MCLRIFKQNYWLCFLWILKWEGNEKKTLPQCRGFSFSDWVANYFEDSDHVTVWVKIYDEFSKFGICYFCHSVTLREKSKTFPSFILINLQFHQILEQCTDNKVLKYVRFLAIPWLKSNFNSSLCRVSLTIRKRLQIAFSVRIYPSLGHICFFFCYVLFWLVFLYHQDIRNKVLVKLFTNLW